MIKHFYYSNGLPFGNDLAFNLDRLKERVFTNKKATLIFIDGGIGEGKTTLAVHLADYFNGAYNFKDGHYFLDKSRLIDFDKQIAMGGVEFKKKLRLCHKNDLHVLVYDEAGDFSGRSALSNFNRNLNRIFDIFRAFKIVVVFCMPSFDAVDRLLLKKKIPRMLLSIKRNNNNYSNYSGFSLWRMRYISRKMEKLTIESDAYQLTECNFRGQFLDLPDARARELDKYTIRGKLDLLDDSRGLVTYKDIANNLGKSVIWVKTKILGLKIKEDSIIKNKKYFAEKTINQLKNRFGG